MNKLTKTVLIIASVLCLIGGVFFVGGLATGGLNKLSSSGQGAAALGGTGKTYSMKKTKLKSFNRLKVNLDTADFILKSSGDDSCYLSYHLTGPKKANPFSYGIENGLLTLTEQQTSNVSVSVNFSYLVNMLRGKAKQPMEKEVVVLYVPDSFPLKQMDARLKDGDASVEGIVCDAMSLTLDYGDLTLKNCSAATSDITNSDGDVETSGFTSKKCNLTLTYGSLEMKDSSIKDGAIRLDDGDFEAKASSFTGKVEAILTYGNAELKLKEEELDMLSLMLETSGGEIEVDGKTMESDDTNHYEKTGSNPANVLSIRSDDGDILIESK